MVIVKVQRFGTTLAVGQLYSCTGRQACMLSSRQSCTHSCWCQGCTCSLPLKDSTLLHPGSCIIHTPPHMLPPIVMHAQVRNTICVPPVRPPAWKGADDDDLANNAEAVDASAYEDDGDYANDGRVHMRRCHGVAGMSKQGSSGDGFSSGGGGRKGEGECLLLAALMCWICAFVWICIE